MNEEERGRMTRRRAIVSGLAGATALAGCAQVEGAGGAIQPSPVDRVPVVYIPHGGGPWPFVELGMDQAELDVLAAYLGALGSVPKARPRALLVVSAHWEERVPTVTTSPRPPMLYDYYGFPAGAYEVTWPAPGDPALAGRVRELLGAGGFTTAEDPERGFDHGAFVPLKLAYPDADVPAIQLSLLAGLDPAEHVAVGRALAPLRDEGVFIVASGMSYHNMRGFRDPRQRGAAERFDAWLGEAMSTDPEERARRLVAWATAPSARDAHPREEHLLPLMVAAGAAGADAATAAFRGDVIGRRVSAFHFGA